MNSQPVFSYEEKNGKRFVLVDGKRHELDDYIIYDNETNTFSKTSEQAVRDDVEKHHWLTVSKTIWKDWRLYLMIIPMLFVFFCWRYLPMYELLASFKTKADAINGQVNQVNMRYFVGYKNFYTVLFGDFRSQFWQAFRNTFMISFYGLVFGFPFPIILALFFNEIKSNVYRSVLQVLTYLPKFISTVIVTSLVVLMVNGNNTSLGVEQPGIICQLLKNLHLLSPEKANAGLLSNPANFRTIFTLTGMWEGAGYGSIVYFAAIIAVSPTSYEAAQMDGASKLQQMRFVVLPAILSTIVIMLIVRIGTLLSVGYEQVILLGGDTGSLTVTGQVVSTLALSWKNADYGTVPELINNVTSMLLVIGANKISSKASGTSLY